MRKKSTYFIAACVSVILTTIIFSGCRLPGNISFQGEIPKYFGVNQESPPNGLIPSGKGPAGKPTSSAEKKTPSVSYYSVKVLSEPDKKCKNCHSNMKLSDQNSRAAFLHEKHLSMTNNIGGCLSCHVAEPHGQKRTKGIKNGICKRCHQTEFPHVGGWRKKHGKLYLKNPNRCTICHTDYKKYCIGCHGTLMPHPGTWKSDHSSESNKASCRQCHPGKDFCTSCHHKTDSQKLTDWKAQHKLVVNSRGSFVCFHCHKPTYCSHCHIHGRAEKTGTNR